MYQIVWKPLIVMPPAYEIPAPFGGYWCKLKDICELVPQIAKLAGNKFNPTPEELVSRFAALTRLNKTAWPDQKKVKVFRYSKDGNDFWGTDVPLDYGIKTFRHPDDSLCFKLDIRLPYQKKLFVTEEWARATLNAVRRGAVDAVDYGDFKMGSRPDGGNRIALAGNIHRY